MKLCVVVLVFGTRSNARFGYNFNQIGDQTRPDADQNRILLKEVSTDMSGGSKYYKPNRDGIYAIELDSRASLLRRIPESTNIYIYMFAAE